MYDFSTLSGTGGALANLGTTEAVSGSAGTINVSGWYDSAGTWTAADLIARGESPTDDGLGVCSPGESCPVGATGGGDVNELSQLTHNEAILLERPAGTTWVDLYVSSLDNNDGFGAEGGTIYWGTSNLSGSALITALLGGPSFSFSYPEFGGTAVEGILPLPGGFDATAQFVLFVPGIPVIPCTDPEGCTVSNNNDYLVWGADLTKGQGDVPVPEPGSLSLLALGLVGLARKVRRSING